MISNEEKLKAIEEKIKIVESCLLEHDEIIKNLNSQNYETSMAKIKELEEKINKIRST